MAAKGMKGLLAWCKKNTEGYKDVNVTNMSSSWKDGLAFCALLHRFHPELIDFDSLSKENVLYNNQLAFSIAEDLGIAAFLDAEDMANMERPDKLSVMTYLSQYYNCFKDSKPGEASPEQIVVNPVNQTKKVDSVKKQADESICTICGKKVHLVQRYFEDGKLYHRSCHRNSSLDAIRGKNYFISKKAVEDVTDTDGATAANNQDMALPKVEAHTMKDHNRVNQNVAADENTQNLTQDSKKDVSLPLPKPRVRTLPKDRKIDNMPTEAVNTPNQSVLANITASKNDSEEDYNDSLNPFGSDTDEDQDTLSSSSSEDDTNPFASSASAPNDSKTESKQSEKQESESENEGNPFGDDDIDEVENDGLGNPFGEPEEEEKTAPTSQHKPSERFNPFSKDEIDEKKSVTEVKNKAPMSHKKAPPRPPNSPAQNLPVKTHKKAPAPPPPTWKSDATQKMTQMNKANEKDTKFPQKKAIDPMQRPLSPRSSSQKMDRFKLRRLSTPKQRAAPGYGHPLVKRKVHIAMSENEITTELKVIDIKLTDYETKGVKLEEMLRYAMNKDVEWTNEEDELLNEWFDLVNKKNILLRDESDLVFQLQQQRLEQEHADIEFELRKLLNKPDSAKNETDKQKEEELLQKLVEVVERRNVIINSIEEERLKEAEEDSVYEQMKWVRDHNSSKKKKKNKVKKMFSKKDKKKDKKPKETTSS